MQLASGSLTLFVLYPLGSLVTPTLFTCCSVRLPSASCSFYILLLFRVKMRLNAFELDDHASSTSTFANVTLFRFKPDSKKRDIVFREREGHT